MAAPSTSLFFLFFLALFRRECWSQDPSDRPDMRDVASRLEQLVRVCVLNSG